jgi:cobalt-zinc-cadmium efflux system protein
MLADAGTLALSCVALFIATRPASPQKTYRNWRFEVIAALFNGLAFLPVSAYIFYEAWQRWNSPVPIRTGPMLAVALVGLATNLVAAALLHRHSHDNVNVRSAFLHVLGDLLGSVAVVATAVVLRFKPLPWLDPLAAALIGLLVLGWSLRLVRDTVAILLEAVPSHVKIEEVQAAIASHDGVAGVHDLHVWTITSKMHACTAHVILREDRPVSECQDLCRALQLMLDEKFDINHVTLQLETSRGEPVCCEHGSGAAVTGG